MITIEEKIIKVPLREFGFINKNLKFITKDEEVMSGEYDDIEFLNKKLAIVKRPMFPYSELFSLYGVSILQEYEKYLSFGIISFEDYTQNNCKDVFVEPLRYESILNGNLNTVIIGMGDKKIFKYYDRKDSTDLKELTKVSYEDADLFDKEIKNFAKVRLNGKIGYLPRTTKKNGNVLFTYEEAKKIESFFKEKTLIKKYGKATKRDIISTTFL